MLLWAAAANNGEAERQLNDKYFPSFRASVDQ